MRIMTIDIMSAECIFPQDYDISHTKVKKKIINSFNCVKADKFFEGQSINKMLTN